jgi:hypothetical protein
MSTKTKQYYVPHITLRTGISLLDESEETVTNFFVFYLKKSFNRIFNLWFAVEESDEELEEVKPKEGAPPTEPTPTISEWDFATEMKKFVFGILEKGEPGLPWHCLLLYLCRDVSYPLAVQKAFTILGAPM